jgi:hypothetical protein
VRPHADDSPVDSHTIEACERLTRAAQGMHIAEHDSGGANPKVLHEWEHVETMFRQAKELAKYWGSADVSRRW